MKISYSILVHNETDTLEKLLKFLVKWKLPDDEIVILDDYYDNILINDSLVLSESIYNFGAISTNDTINMKTVIEGEINDYELIFTSSSKNDLRIRAISNKYDVKITKVGRITNKEGIFLDGKKINELVNEGIITKERLDEIVDRTKKGGAEIVKYLEKGSAFYAPAASGIEMADCYLNDKKKILPCAAFLQGEYGVKDLYAGVPVIIGKGGVEKTKVSIRDIVLLCGHGRNPSANLITI